MSRMSKSTREHSVDNSVSRRKRSGRDPIAGQYWKVKYRIGSGSFGEIYLGLDIRTGKKVAVKVERMDSKYPQLLEEHHVYASMMPHVGVPNILWCGRTGRCNVMVMELLGDSLETLYNKCQRHFSLRTVLLLAIQLIHRIQFHHENAFLHRDIKPDNFLMGLGIRSHIVHMIDMGLCKRYRDIDTGKHVSYKENKKLIGTPRYASVNAHLGREQSRSDDLESIGYMLLYFYLGRLPWQGLKASNKQEKYLKISRRKVATSVDQLCANAPYEFNMYLKYCRRLQFSETPDYTYLCNLFYQLYMIKGYPNEWEFDWMKFPDYEPSHYKYVRRLEVSENLARSSPHSRTNSRSSNFGRYPRQGQQQERLLDNGEVRYAVGPISDDVRKMLAAHPPQGMGLLRPKGGSNAGRSPQGPQGPGRSSQPSDQKGRTRPLPQASPHVEEKPGGGGGAGGVSGGGGGGAVDYRGQMTAQSPTKAGYDNSERAKLLSENEMLRHEIVALRRHIQLYASVPFDYDKFADRFNSHQPSGGGGGVGSAGNTPSGRVSSTAPPASHSTGNWDSSGYDGGVTPTNRMPPGGSANFLGNNAGASGGVVGMGNAGYINSNTSSQPPNSAGPGSPANSRVSAGPGPVSSVWRRSQGAPAPAGNTTGAGQSDYGRVGPNGQALGGGGGNAGVGGVVGTGGVRSPPVQQRYDVRHNMNAGGASGSPPPNSGVGGGLGGATGGVNAPVGSGGGPAPVGSEGAGRMEVENP